MIFSLLPTSVLAANSNANDKIKITVRVFDPVTGGTWVVGEDTCQKADKYVQSVEYEIPALSKFVKNNTQTVQKVVGNWYFPAGDRWVGATVEWSNNASNVTMTYWVNNFKFAGDDGGTGGGSSGSGSEESGSGNYSMTYTIVYHSNYPSGTDYQQTFSYTIRAGYNIGNTGRTVSVKSLNDLDFTAPEGYKVAAHPWNTAKDGSGTSVDSMCHVKPNSTTHLYAQWAPATTTEYVTLTYMDGDTKYAEKSYEKDKTVTVIDCTTQKTGYTFKGWDTDKAATTVVYGTDSTFTIKKDTTLYAVWEEDGPAGPDLPSKPTETDVNSLNGTVKVTCMLSDREPNPNHASKTYALASEGYQINDDMTWDNNFGWITSITVDKNVYIQKYIDDLKLPHKERGSLSSQIWLQWNESDSKWEFKDVLTDSMLEIPVKDVNKPDYDDLKDAIGKITVKDINTPDCGDKEYDLIANGTGGSGAMNWSEMRVNSDDGTAWKVVIHKAPYVEKYNGEMSYKEHVLVSDSKLELVVKYTAADGWKLASGQNAVIEVKHTATIPDPGANAFSNLKVQIKCNTKTDGSHDLQLSYSDGTYKFVRRPEPQYGYVVFTAADYLNTYNKANPGHELKNASAAVTWEFEYKDGKWQPRVDNKLPTIEVVCKDKPEIPSKKDVQFTTVRIQCVQPESVVRHNDSENAIAGAIGNHSSAYQLGTEVRQGMYNGETRYYVDCEITDVTPYIADFNYLYSGHTEATEPEHVLKFKLWYCPENENVQGKHVWEADTVPTIYVKCEAAPSKPTEDQQKDMLTGKIKVTCVLDDENLGRKENEAHQPAGVYALEAGGYTGADSVVWNSTYNCWTYAITVNKDYYVDKFNAEKKLPHTEVSSATTAFTFKWDSSTSSWSLLEAPGIENPSATNDIWCEIRVKDVYSPGNDELKNLIGKVKVVDDNTTSCGDKDYDLITTGDALMKMAATIAQGQYDLTRYIITVKAQPYVDAYNAVMKAAGKYDKHELNSGATMTLTVEYVAGTGWTIADGKVPLEVHVKHSSVPDPSIPDKDKLDGAVLDSIVRIECATANSGHTYVVKQLKDAAATNYTVAYTDGDNTATVTIKNAQAYADLFKPQSMTHTFDASNSDNRLSFTLKWSQNATSGVWGWALEDQTAYAKIMTTCDYPGHNITPPEEYLKKEGYVVQVTHINDGATHDYHQNNRQLLQGNSPDDYVITPVTTDSNGATTCTVTIKDAKPYVDWYDQAVADPNPVTIHHRLAANETTERTFQMTWNAAADKWDYEIVEYKVTCANPSTDTHHVNYSYESGVAGVELPTEIANTAPTDSTPYAKGATVKLAAKPNDVTVGDYVWSFQTWKIGTEEKDPETTVTMPDGDLNVVGIWTRQHTAPGAEDIKKALGAEEKTVKVVCVTAANQHKAHDYQAVIGLPQQCELFPAVDYSGYTGYPVSLNTGLFLAKYIADEGVHTLAAGTPDTITWIVYWNDTESEWRADPYNDAAKKSIDVEHVNYTVSFDGNGGTGTMNSETVIAGSKYTLPACGFTAPSNKKFDGWEINGTKYAVGASIEVNSNVIVKALWTDKSGSGSGGSSRDDSYTLRYDTNGGEKLSSESKSSKWTKDYEDLPIPTREGYRFDGWYYDSKLKNEVTDDVKVNTSVVTLYAGWTAVEVPSMLNGDDHFAYVQGYKDGMIRPYGLISRAETTTIFFRLLKDSVRDGNLLTSNTYTDVTDSYWANTAISTMTGLGIVQGRSADTFDPNAPITRAQFAAICARFDTGKTYGSQSFSDIQGHWAQAYIERAAELGWIKGFEDGTFRPDTYITRAQAMTMINRVLNRTPDDEDDLLDNMNVWPDCTPNDWFYLAVQEATNSHDFKYQGGEVWTKLTKAPDWSRYEH